MSTPIVLLVGQIPLSIGYLHAALEKNKITVHSLILDDALPVHPQSINHTWFSQEFSANWMLSKKQQITNQIRRILKLKHVIMPEDIAQALTHFIQTQAKKLTFIRSKLNYPVSNFIEPSKSALQLLYPQTLATIGDNAFFCTCMYIDKYNPDIIGFQVLPSERQVLFSIIKKIHMRYPSKKIIAGGLFPTTMYPQLFQLFPFLIIVCGEGEETVPTLVQQLHHNGDLESIPGIAYINQGQIIKTAERPLLLKIDTIPFPERTITNIPPEHETAIWIITSRGCPAQCSFCALPAISQRHPRYRSIENIIAELEQIQQKYPQVKTIKIADDSFFINPQRVIDFCTEVINRKMTFTFTCQGRIKPITETMVKKLAAAGFTQISLGLESGSDKILANAHKGICRQDMIKALSLFSKTNINVCLNLMVGLPGETWETIKETMHFVKQLQHIHYIFQVNIGIVRVYPKTELYQELLDKNIVTDAIWHQKYESPVYTAEHSVETLLQMYYFLETTLCTKKIITLKGFLYQFPILVFAKNKPRIIKQILQYIFRR